MSVVVPLHRDGEDVRRCLRALAALDPAPVEVVAVVDGAAPEVVELVASTGAWVVPLPRQGGPARARNVGAARAVGDVLLFVDADVEVSPDLVGRAAAYLAAHPHVDAVIGSYDDTPSAPNFLSQYKNLLNHYVHQCARTEGYTFWGACGAVRRRVFDDLGGFDESYREPSVEDIELGYRLRAAGHRIHVVKQMQVKHLKHWEPMALLRADVLCRALPWSTLILRSGRFDDDLNIDHSGRAKVVATAALGLGLLTVRAPAGRVTAAVSAAALLALDARLLRFYAERRGSWFAAATIPWLWLSYAYSGGAFAAALASHLMERSCVSSSPVAPASSEPTSSTG